MLNYNDFDADIVDEMAVEESITDKGNEILGNAIEKTIASFDHNMDNALNVSNEVDQIKTLVSDDVYDQMITEIWKDTTISTSEKVNQSILLRQQRSEEQKKEADIVKEMQSRKAENYEKVSKAHTNMIFAGISGILTLVCVIIPQLKDLRQNNGELYLMNSDTKAVPMHEKKGGV